MKNERLIGMTLKDPVCGKTVEVTVTESEHRLNIRQAFCSTACMRAYHDLQQLRITEMAALRANVRSDCHSTRSLNPSPRL